MSSAGVASSGSPENAGGNLATSPPAVDDSKAGMCETQDLLKPSVKTESGLEDEPIPHLEQIKLKTCEESSTASGNSAELRPIATQPQLEAAHISTPAPDSGSFEPEQLLRNRRVASEPSEGIGGRQDEKPRQSSAQVQYDMRKVVDEVATLSRQSSGESSTIGSEAGESEEEELGFWSLIQQEFKLPTHKDPSPGRTAARVRMFFALPYHLEQFIILGQMVCLNSFMFLLGFMPIRFVHGLIQLLFVHGPAWLMGVPTTSSAAWAKVKRYKCDVARGLMIIISLLWLLSVKNAEIYHYIRGQSLMKLYVIFNMLYIFDRLLTSLGDDVVDSMYTSLEDENASALNQLGHFVLAAIYCALHSLTVLTQVITMNVAVNSDGNALFVIVVSSNFIELKSIVFKKYFHATMFQISCSDVVERFQAFVVMVTVTIQNLSHMGLARLEMHWLNRIAMTMAVLYCAEMLVDWIKHGFQNKFNHLPNYYRVFRTVICRDIVIFHSRRHEHPHFHSVARRFGCMIEPLGVVILRALIIAFASLKCSVMMKIYLIAACLVCAIAVKIMVTVLLLAYASNHLLTYSNNGQFNPLEPIVLPDDYMQAPVRNKSSSPLPPPRVDTTPMPAHHRRRSSLTSFLASIPGAARFFTRSSMDQEAIAAAAAAAAAATAVLQRQEEVVEPPTPRTVGGFKPVTFNEPSPVTAQKAAASDATSSSAAAASAGQEVKSATDSKDYTVTDLATHRKTADTIGTWMSLGGFIPTAADKEKAAKNPLPIESVVRYNMYGNKIPV